MPSVKGFTLHNAKKASEADRSKIQKLQSEFDTKLYERLRREIHKRGTKAEQRLRNLTDKVIVTSEKSVVSSVV